jgi:hypothetical protein
MNPAKNAPAYLFIWVWKYTPFLEDFVLLLKLDVLSQELGTGCVC